MTQEEARQILEDYVKACRKDDFFKIETGFTYEEVIEVMNMGAKSLLSHSLPSDLDEVAIPELEMTEWMKYGPHTNYPWCTVPDAIKITAEHFFDLGKQAGAEWGSNHLRDSAKMAPDGMEEAAENTYKTPFGTRAEDFKAGAEWMAGQGWISVNERLPEMDEEVIVLTDELGTAPIYKISFGHIVDVERCIDYNGWNIPGVKYWMPCPEIPNND